MLFPVISSSAHVRGNLKRFGPALPGFTHITSPITNKQGE